MASQTADATKLEDYGLDRDTVHRWRWRLRARFREENPLVTVCDARGVPNLEGKAMTDDNLTLDEEARRLIRQLRLIEDALIELGRLLADLETQD